MLKPIENHGIFTTNLNWLPSRELSISHLGKRKIIFKSDFWWNMLIPRRVYIYICIYIAGFLNHPQYVNTPGPVQNLQWVAMDCHGWRWPWALLFSLPGYANHICTAPFLDVFLEAPNGAPWEEFKPLFLGGWPSKTEVMAGFERLLVSVLLNSHEGSMVWWYICSHLNGWFLG